MKTSSFSKTLPLCNTVPLEWSFPWLMDSKKLRLKNLHSLLKLPVDMRKVKVDAWFIKKSCVLIKKKITRKQWPRNENFVALMKEVLGIHDCSSSDVEETKGKKTILNLPKKSHCWKGFAKQTFVYSHDIFKIKTSKTFCKRNAYHIESFFFHFLNHHPHLRAGWR